MNLESHTKQITNGLFTKKSIVPLTPEPGNDLGFTNLQERGECGRDREKVK